MKNIYSRKDLHGDSLELCLALEDLYCSTSKEEYEKNAEALWNKLNIKKEKYHYIKVKAMLMKAVHQLFAINIKRDKSFASYHDTALVIYDLLPKSYYIDNEILDRDLSKYQIRYRLYLEKNKYAQINSTQSESYSSKRRERITASIANFLSLQTEADIKAFLKEALKEYTVVNKNGQQILKLQEPVLTLENFPSLARTEPSDRNKHQSHKSLIGAIILKGRSGQQFFGITPIEESEFEYITNKDAEKEYAPMQPDTNTDRLSFVKTDYGLLDYAENICKAKPILNLFKKHANAILMALSMTICSFRSSCQPLFCTNQLSIVGHNGIYNELNPDFTVETSVRTVWGDGTDLKIGDRVEFQIVYKNTSDFTHNRVIIGDILPANLRYVPGSTILYNALHPAGATVERDSIIDDGLIIGNYEGGTNAFVRFTAEVVDDNFTCGKFILRNWGRGSVGTTLVQDSADVNVQLAYCPDPENDIEA